MDRESIISEKVNFKINRFYIDKNKVSPKSNKLSKE